MKLYIDVGSNIIDISKKRTIIRNKGVFKKNIKSLAFSIKSVKKRFLENSSGIIGIFLLFNKVFNKF